MNKKKGLVENLQQRPKTVGDLREHMLITYVHLRIVMVVVAFFLPLALVLAGSVHGSWLDSMSASYHSDHPAVRDIFVGCMWALGSALIAYRGFRPLEDWLLTGAGVCAVGVAMVPVQTEKGFTWHAAFAIGLFALCAVVCLVCTQDTLRLGREEHDRAIPRYRTVYRVIGPAMIVIPGIAWFWLRGRGSQVGLFAAEMIAFWLFAAYWLVKTYELRLPKVQQTIVEEHSTAPLPTADQHPASAPGA